MVRRKKVRSLATAMESVADGARDALRQKAEAQPNPGFSRDATHETDHGGKKCECIEENGCQGGPRELIGAFMEHINVAPKDAKCKRNLVGGGLRCKLT